jgi:hypothetical protein
MWVSTLFICSSFAFVLGYSGLLDARRHRRPGDILQNGEIKWFRLVHEKRKLVLVYDVEASMQEVIRLPMTWKSPLTLDWRNQISVKKRKD